MIQKADYSNVKEMFVRYFRNFQLFSVFVEIRKSKKAATASDGYSKLGARGNDSQKLVFFKKKGV